MASRQTPIPQLTPVLTLHDSWSERLRWQAPLAVALIVCLSWLVYRPALHGGWILDDELLTQNKLIKAPDGLYRFWFTTEPTDYWPVTSSVFWLQWRWWGAQPLGYHMMSLALHVVDVLLLWLLLRRLAIPGAFLAALIFAVHPVNVESVAWISQQKNLLALLFLLLSCLCYLHSEQRRSAAEENDAAPSAWPWYLLSLMLFIMGMLSKGSVVVLPALLLLMIWWRRQLIRWDILRSVPFFLLGGLLTLLNVWFQTHGADTAVRHITPLERLLGAVSVVWFYLYKSLWPTHLIFVYPQWSIQASQLRWWLPLMAAAAVTLLLGWQIARRTDGGGSLPVRWARPLWFAWAFFCISLVPVMGFTDVGYMQYSLVADHYQHIAIIAVCAMIAAGWSCGRAALPATARWAADIVAVVYIAGLAFLAWQQCEVYRDPFTLYETTLEKNPDCCLAHNNLANMLSEAGDKQAAIDHFRESLKIKPDQPQVCSNLGVTLIEVGKPEEGIAALQQALQLDPNFADAEFNWGQALRKAGQPAAAIEHLARAVQLKSDNPLHFYILGLALMETGQPELAIKSLQAAHELDPDDSITMFTLAVAYLHAGHVDEALAAGQQAREMARTQHQAAMAEQIDAWLKEAQAQQPGQKH